MLGRDPKTKGISNVIAGQGKQQTRTCQIHDVIDERLHPEKKETTLKQRNSCQKLVYTTYTWSMCLLETLLEMTTDYH